MTRLPPVKLIVEIDFPDFDPDSAPDPDYLRERVARAVEHDTVFIQVNTSRGYPADAVGKSEGKEAVRWLNEYYEGDTYRYDRHGIMPVTTCHGHLRVIGFGR